MNWLNFRNWHFSDMPDQADDVGYWGRSGQVAANFRIMDFRSTIWAI
jgi:hypothetical protein